MLPAHANCSVALAILPRLQISPSRFASHAPDVLSASTAIPKGRQQVLTGHAVMSVTWCSVNASAEPSQGTRLDPDCFNAMAFGARIRPKRRDSQGGERMFLTYRRIWRGLVYTGLVMESKSKLT